VALAVLAVLVLDVAKGGEATPEPYLGEAKGERFAYGAPTATPTGVPGVTPTAVIGQPGAPSRPGDPNARDAQRRDDLIELVAAAGRYKEQNGAFPTTNGNVQSLCAYVDLDQGCLLEQVLSPLPSDPLGEPLKNGYWYSSDGQRATFYAALEVAVPEEQQCETDDAELVKKSNLVCIDAT
jgi:hypothetical protein